MFEIGKIPPEILEKIVMKPMMGSKVKREDVILRPTTGEDCSAIDLGGEICILSTDPITGAAKDIGYLAVQINCNDIYSAGAEPMGVLLTVLLPPGSDEELLEEIMEGSLRAAEEKNIEIDKETFSILLNIKNFNTTTKELFEKLGRNKCGIL